MELKSGKSQVAAKAVSLLEQEHLSYGNRSENRLIQADNLLALTALEPLFAERIQCVYIDPPYNTGNEFINYNDQREHSRWLQFMRDRVQILRRLLSSTGVLFVSIGEDECHYLKIVIDEIFGRSNYLGSLIWEKKKKPSFRSKMAVVTEYVLVFAKDKNQCPNLYYGFTTADKKYPINNAGNGVRILSFPAKSVSFLLPDQKVPTQDMSGGNIVTRLLDDVDILDGTNVNAFRLEGEWRYSQSRLNEIIQRGENLTIARIPFRPNHVKSSVARKKMKNLLSRHHFSMSTYEDASEELNQLFGEKVFDYPKPERLLQVLLESATREGDWVLDAFLGSGTTSAVAHKMGRKWIGIERGEQALGICQPRMKMVVDGEQGGISTDVGWTGGSGFRFYRIASSES